MFSKVSSMGINGIDGYEVSVECYITTGMPGFEVVGLPDAAVKEARERVRAAIKNCGFKFPISHITLNLAPAGTKKSGTIYDLPILLGILCATKYVVLPKKRCAFLGELSLEGELRSVCGILPMALAAKECGIEELYVPMENAKEASLAEGLTVYGVSNVKTLVEHLSGEKTIEPIEHWEPEETPRIMYDFADVKSQSFAKRAMEIAAAGGHNILLIGPPGAGKSMLAQRLPSILPPLSKEEAMEVAKIYSIMGMLSEKEPLVRICPFRSPHHTISAPGLTGGGSTPRPGEITLAHNGVLFLDELPEFHRDALEVLRQPMEEGKVSIVRVSGTEVFPSRFMMVCAMNPCKCGWFGDPSGRCRCSENAVSRYIGKISGPLLDRMDLVVQVPSLSFREVSYELPSEPSSEIQKRVVAAREVQRERYKGTNTRFNAVMEPAQMRKWCALDEAGTQLMKDAFDVMNLTARSYDRVLRVARTIADLDGSENITEMHIAEAVQYRNYKLEVPGK